mgnify:CR=1 FL=1
MTDGGAHGIIGNLAKCVNNLANRLDEGTSPPDVVLSPQQPVFSLMKTLLPKMADGGISTEVAKAELAKLNQAMLTLFKKCKPIVGSASVERAAKAWSSICAILDTGDRKGASADSALKSIEVMTSAFGDFCDSYKDKRESAKGSRIGSGLHGKKTKKMVRADKPAIFLCTPIKAFQDKWGITDSVIVNEVIPAIRRVAERNGLPVIDLHPVITDASDMTGDMIHPNDKGAKKMAETVAAAIRENQKDTK